MERKGWAHGLLLKVWLAGCDIRASLGLLEEHPVGGNTSEYLSISKLIIECLPHRISLRAHTHTHTHTPVNAGVEQDSRVCGQLGQMNHLGLLLQSVALIHPHIWQSAGVSRTHSQLLQNKGGYSFSSPRGWQWGFLCSVNSAKLESQVEIWRRSVKSWSGLGGWALIKPTTIITSLSSNL